MKELETTEQLTLKRETLPGPEPDRAAPGGGWVPFLRLPALTMSASS